MYISKILDCPPAGHVLLDGADVCKLVRSESRCEAAAAARSSLGRSG